MSLPKPSASKKCRNLTFSLSLVTTRNGLVQQTPTLAVTVDWLLLTRWRSVVRHVTMRARATRRVVS